MQICILPIGIMLSDKSKEIQLEEKLLKLPLHHNQRLMY